MAKGRGQHKGRSSKSQHGVGRVRIIGGHWRGSRLEVPDIDGLRPTGDRARETLFNWLAPHMPCVRCLDLFAGSGALGLEAASRGAEQVVLVERDRRAASSIEVNIARLGGDGIAVHCGDALAFLTRENEPFDVVFIDPPFQAGLQEPVLQVLMERGLVRPGGLVYVECERGDTIRIPAGLLIDRQQSLGQVEMRLLKAGGQTPQP